ncbi:flocculation protein FLO11-like [Solanum verrucosum]|uniref:flocculation protein FLO11-like n=1 Tax=Solanum verrucosum TaxID=315347 RepID=UPI0020D0E9D9|nr:flocculation protein FLO11-like [Solanum verrucosum]
MEGYNSMMRVAIQIQLAKRFQAKADQVAFIRMTLVVFEAVSFYCLSVNWRKTSIFPIKEVPQLQSLVVSFCLKEGASAIGLKGMKAVAKDYMKCGRVGIAKLSPGVTIYLCPPTNAIFIILEKYGFLKGTAAVEGNSQLMIGCVVWQKNRTALTSVLKKSEEKANSLQEQLQKSPSDSSRLQGGGQGSLSMPSVKNSNPSAPLSSFSNLEQANVTDNKSIDIDSASRTTLTASGVKSPPFQQKKSELSGSHLWGSKGHLSSSEASCVHQSNDEPPKESRNLPKPVTSLLSNASKRKMAFPDDDDLPEFDFGTASGISSSSHRSYGSIIGNRLQLSGSRILDMSKQPTRPVAPSACMTIPRQMEEKHYSQSHAIPVTVPVRAYGSPMVPFHSSGKKNLFCDDDIPEWLPPDAQNERTNEPPKTFPPEYPTSRMLLPLPTGSVFPYPSSAPTHDSFSSQPSPLYHLPANSRVPPPIPSQKGPSNLTGFTFNSVPRPQSSSRAAASSLKPADKRVRRS